MLAMLESEPDETESSANSVTDEALSNSYGGQVAGKERHPVKGPACLEFIQGVQFSLYLSHALSAWGDRMWGFGAGLFLSSLSDNGSLQLVAIYGFVNGGSILLLGAIVGDLVDRTPRLKMMLISLILQNVAVVMAAVVMSIMFAYPVALGTGTSLYYVCVTLVIIISSGAGVASMGTTLALEKDWVPHIQKNSTYSLARMNSTLRGIDLATKILAPILVGVIAKVQLMYASIFVAMWNIFSLVAEFGLLYRVYSMVPSLSSKDDKAASVLQAMFSTFFTLIRGWSVYMRFSTRWAGLGLAFLYMTVLGFDNITIAYTYHQGIGEDVLGGMMALAGLFGITATFTFPFFQRRFGVDLTGRFGFSFECVCLILSLVSIGLPGSPFLPHGPVTAPVKMADNSSIGELVSNLTSVSNSTSHDNPDVTEPQFVYTSVIVFLAGIIVARYGLWTADLSVTQVLIEEVDEGSRGVVNGVQTSLNRLMDILKYVLVMGVYQYYYFGYLIILSFIFVFIGAIFFLTFTLIPREKKSEGAATLVDDDQLGKEAEDVNDPYAPVVNDPYAPVVNDPYAPVVV